MENPFIKRRNRYPLNVVQEVGRDPLRVPLHTPPEQTVNVARALGIARQRLMTVLPQPNREQALEVTELLASQLDNATSLHPDSEL